MKKPNTTKIDSQYFWFKVVGMLQQNWALIENEVNSSSRKRLEANYSAV